MGKAVTITPASIIHAGYDEHGVFHPVTVTHDDLSISESLGACRGAAWAVAIELAVAAIVIGILLCR